MGQTWRRWRFFLKSSCGRCDPYGQNNRSNMLHQSQTPVITLKINRVLSLCTLWVDLSLNSNKPPVLPPTKKVPFLQTCPFFLEDVIFWALPQAKISLFKVTVTFKEVSSTDFSKCDSKPTKSAKTKTGALVFFYLTTKIIGYTPQKSNIDTNNCHFLRVPWSKTHHFGALHSWWSLPPSSRWC